MKTSDFSFELPPELIAKQPLERRSDSRLLQLDRHQGGIQHRQFCELPELLRQGDLLVFNDTRVIPARLFGHKDSGGRFEALVERVVDDRRLLVQLRVSKSPGPDSELRFESRDPERAQGVARATVLGRREQFYVIELGEGCSVEELLEQCGHIPLPPYIDRDDRVEDQQRYQTVYASRKGAVAAPTAGLHFDDRILDRLAERGIEQAFVTLHVGAGTFQPVRVDDVNEHRMHSEWYELPEHACAAIAACRRRGGRVIAVGTTSVRTLEACGRVGELRPQTGETDIFIYPGFDFRVVDGLITNFHLPESTLLMLVSAFSDKEKILGAYREAVEQKYRFFSYGDAMLIL